MNREILNDYKSDCCFKPVKIVNKDTGLTIGVFCTSCGRPCRGINDIVARKLPEWTFKITFTCKQKGKDEKIMVEHLGLNHAEILQVENFINDIKSKTKPETDCDEEFDVQDYPSRKQEGGPW